VRLIHTDAEDVVASAIRTAEEDEADPTSPGELGEPAEEAELVPEQEEEPEEEAEPEGIDPADDGSDTDTEDEG
jgi:hypothetical protein